MPLWLDLGPVGQQVPPGWTDCNPVDCGDAARFVQPPHDAPSGEMPDPVTGDALHGGVLHLTLPPGTYQAWAWVGRGVPTLDDVSAPAAISVGPTTVWSETGPTRWETFAQRDLGQCWPHYAASSTAGATVWTSSPPAQAWVETATFTVSDEGARIRLTGRPLQGLVVAPADDRDAVLAQLAVEDALRVAWRQTHLPPVRPPPNPLPGLSTGPLERGPTRSVEAADRLTLWRDDRQTVAVWLPTDAPATVSVRAPDDLTVETWELGWLDARQHASRPLATRPTWLIPTEGAVRGGQGLPAGVALTLHVPTTARAGRHSVQISLRQDGHTYRARWVVDVRSQTLPPATPTVGWFHQQDPAKIRLDGPRDEALARDLTRASSLGANAAAIKGLMWGEPFPEGVARGGERFLDVADRWRSLGGQTLLWGDPKEPVRPLTYLAGSGHLPTALQDPLKTLLAAASQPGLDVVVTFWEEEGGWKNATATRLAERLIPDLHALMPGLPLAATAGHPMDRAVAGLFDVVLVGNLPALSANTLDGIRAAGSRAWAYNAAPGATGPLGAWAAGAETLLQWHWDPTTLDPCDDATLTPTWWYATELPGEILAHTTLAESMARGIRITRLLTAIAHTIEAHPDHPAAARGAALLEATRAALDGATPSVAFDGEVWPTFQVDALEAAATAALDALGR